MAGTGNFDLTKKEIAKIFELIEHERFKELEDLYKKLSEERL